MISYYDVSEDKYKEVTQEWVDEVCRIQLISYKRLMLIRAVSNLNIQEDERLIRQLAEILKV
jgi:hypothetical protein